MKLRSVLVVGWVMVSVLGSAWAEESKCEPKFGSEQAAQPAAKNPFFKRSKLPYEAVPFDQIQAEHFRPALLKTLKKAKARLEAIRTNPDEPTFANTIEALERVGEPMDYVSSIFYNYLSMQTDPVLEKLAEEINPKLSKFSNSIFFDTVLFRRVKQLHEARKTLGLTTEEMTVLENTYRAFVRNGAMLSAREKARVGAIDERLSVLTEQFKKNVNEATNSYLLEITNAADLAGIPENAVKAAAETARKKGKEGSWVFTLQMPSYRAVLERADKRDLRETMWLAYNARATSGTSDNKPVLLEIAKLREERAHILGYKTHAHYTTEDRMAANPETVETFLTKLADVYRPAAVKDVEELSGFAGHEIKPWDVAYYSEKLSQQKFNFDSEELRPYFSLENVIKGAFYAASRLHNITFKQRWDLPTWDPNVRAFEVRDSNRNFLALFYLDPFPRDPKRPGAWMNAIREGGEFAGEVRRPHVLNVGNFTPPVDGEPALLSLDDVYTVFHELGHGLHGMLTQVRFRSIAGTNVAWDFVELPSQLNENWAIEPEVLDVYARHYKTGERIPAELVEKVRKAATFQAGYVGLRQIMLGMIDLGWHARDLSQLSTADDVAAWEAKAIAPYLVVTAPGMFTSPSFNHIFSGGYSGGYYSYKWADVLAADAFSVFKQEGVFNPDIARKFRAEILEKGGSENPALLYRRFRGGEPDPDALLRKEGLIP